jgi:hypothetical protein
MFSPANPRASCHPRLRIFCFIAMASFPWTVLGVTGSPPLSMQRQVLPLDSIEQLVMAPTDVAAELTADKKSGVATPLRFAVQQKVSITPTAHGTWETFPEGRLWRLRVASSNATDLNFAFTGVWLPEGATLHIISEANSYYQGPYTSIDNKPHGQLWTPLVPGDRAVIELFVPAQAGEEPALVLSQVNNGYRDWFKSGGNILKSEGPCNIDVVCPQGIPWTNEIRSVAVYSISGAFECSGSLIADSAGDLKSYFLTANHCGLSPANASSVVVYWNYQSATCGTHGPGSLAQNQSGAIFRASNYDVDFALIQLEALPDPSFNVFYTGWDRSGVAPAGCVGIHHPDVDVKAISLSSNTLTSATSCIVTGGPQTHWQVIWSQGVTEPGSSGSGIWNPANHGLVGTLSGGHSACSTPLAPDCYGKFSLAWASGTSAIDRLQDWLDPQNSGVTLRTGVDPAKVTVFTAAGSSLLAEGCSPGNGVIDPGEAVTVTFTVQNIGGVAATNLVATLLATNGIFYPGPPQNYGVVATNGGTASRSFAFTAGGSCGATITAVLQLQDGSRNLGLVSFPLTLGVPTTPAIIFSQNFDSVTAPALPAGWSVSRTPPGTLWASTTAASDTFPNAVFAPDPDTVSDNLLTSPSIPITSSNAQLSFQHSYDLEAGFGGGFDGGVLEISINGGAFTDIRPAGGTFVSNGYNEAISTGYGNPLAGRLAWSGTSPGFVQTIVNLPPNADGGNVRLRWRLGSDSSDNYTGWYVDTVSISVPVYDCCHPIAPPSIVDVRRLPPSQMVFSYDSLPGTTYVIETRTNLTIGYWTAIQTNVGNGMRLSCTNSTTSGAAFFRLRAQ